MVGDRDQVRTTCYSLPPSLPVIHNAAALPRGMISDNLNGLEYPVICDMIVVGNLGKNR